MWAARPNPYMTAHVGRNQGGKRVQKCERSNLRYYKPHNKSQRKIRNQERNCEVFGQFLFYSYSILTLLSLSSNSPQLFRVIKEKSSKSGESGRKFNILHPHLRMNKAIHHQPRARAAGRLPSSSSPNPRAVRRLPFGR